MPDTPQRRHFARISFDAQYLLLSTNNDQQWRGTVIDLSLKGALLHKPPALTCKRDDHFVLELILGQDSLNIQMDVNVAHVHETMIGVTCEHIDLESMTHLRRLLELNLGDPNLIERELSEMIRFNQQ